MKCLLLSLLALECVVCINANNYTSRALANSWISLQESEDYTARHECSFVQAGNKFYMFGGRENSETLDVYDYGSNKWSRGAKAPEEYNHFQATAYEGLIWVIGAFRDNDFPTEEPMDHVGVYDPANNVWMQGPSIPRPRGGGGLVVHNDKFYLVAGNTNGHSGPIVRWFDEYNPYTGTWKQLPDAPHERDHFHAVTLGNKLYAVGGRRTKTSNVFGDTVGAVDIYDFQSNKWLTSNLPSDLPSPRAGAGTVAFDGKIIVMGGESGEQGSAYSRVDALDVGTGNWQTLQSMNHGRHGTQAIVSGQGIFIAGGSPSKGGGRQKNMEVYNANAPAGTASSAGVLTGPSQLEIDVGASETVTIQHVSGNQGVFVQSIYLQGGSANNFQITSNPNAPILIGQGGKLDISVKFNGNSNGSAKLVLNYSGDQSLSVTLNGRAGPPTPVPPPTPEPTKMPVVPPADPLAISDIILVDAQTNTDIVSLLHNPCNGCFESTKQINVRAETVGSVGSVEFTLSGAMSHEQTEGAAPYALFGDSSGDYGEMTLPNGDYTLKVQAFSGGGRW